MRKSLLEMKIEFKFIPPDAPHHSSIWESMVKIIKRVLHVLLDKATMKFMAAVVLAEMAAFICVEMQVKFSRRILWMDSAVSLYQIKNRTAGQKAFVPDWVSKIHELTSPNEWRWTPGEFNCAEYCSQGIEADNWESWNRFHHGLDFLRQDEEFWPRVSDNLLWEGQEVCSAF